MDFGSNSDPYIVFNGAHLCAEHKTDVVKKCRFPAWNLAAFAPMPLAVPWSRALTGQYQILAVYDSDFGSKDDHMGWVCAYYNAITFCRLLFH